MAYLANPLAAEADEEGRGASEGTVKALVETPLVDDDDVLTGAAGLLLISCCCELPLPFLLAPPLSLATTPNLACPAVLITAGFEKSLSKSSCSSPSWRSRLLGRGGEPVRSREGAVWRFDDEDRKSVV